MENVSLRQVLENNYEQGLLTRENSREKSSDKKRKSSKEIEMVQTSILTKSRALSDLVNYIEAVKFSSFDIDRNFWEMSSFEETKAISLLRKDSSVRVSFYINLFTFYRKIL